MSEHTIRFSINGSAHEVTVPSTRLLLDVLRLDLGLTGTKEGCGIGVCGACSVLVDEKLMTSCLLPAVFVDGAAVRTVEGLAADDGSLSPLQEWFIRKGGFQCGICTPGQLVAATALLAEVPHPSEETVKRWLMGNLCRCTGYYQLIDAVLNASVEPATSAGDAVVPDARRE